MRGPTRAHQQAALRDDVRHGDRRPLDGRGLGLRGFNGGAPNAHQQAALRDNVRHGDRRPLDGLGLGLRIQGLWRQ